MLPATFPFFIECTTDNTNRTVASVRSIFTKNGGSLGTNGSLEFLFDRKGVFTIERGKIEMTLEELELELIEGGAEDFEESEVKEDILKALELAKASTFDPIQEFGKGNSDFIDEVTRKNFSFFIKIIYQYLF